MTPDQSQFLDGVLATVNPSSDLLLFGFRDQTIVATELNNGCPTKKHVFPVDTCKNRYFGYVYPEEEESRLRKIWVIYQPDNVWVSHDRLETPL